MVEVEIRSWPPEENQAVGRLLGTLRRGGQIEVQIGLERVAIVYEEDGVIVGKHARTDLPIHGLPTFKDTDISDNIWIWDKGAIQAVLKKE